MTARLFVVRHGNTFAPGEPPRRIGRRTDIPLVPDGLAQADALGHHFAGAGIRFGQALTGPLLRTRQTAKTILSANAGGATMEMADWLAEIDHGPDEDRVEADVIQRIGAHALAAWDADAIPPPGWIVDRDARIAAWEAMLDDPATGDTLLVTSNGAARFALLARPGLATAAMRLRGQLKLRTGAYGVIEIEAGALRLVEWDRRPD